MLLPEPHAFSEMRIIEQLWTIRLVSRPFLIFRPRHLASASSVLFQHKKLVVAIAAVYVVYFCYHYCC